MEHHLWTPSRTLAVVAASDPSLRAIDERARKQNLDPAVWSHVTLHNLSLSIVFSSFVPALLLPFPNPSTLPAPHCFLLHSLHRAFDKPNSANAGAILWLRYFWT